MTYRLIQSLIATGKTEGLADKMDILFVAGRLTETEYNELTAMLTQRT